MAGAGANEAPVFLKLQHPEIGLRTVPEIDPDLPCHGPNPDRAVRQGLQVLHLGGPFRIIFEEILADEAKHFFRRLADDNARSAYHRLAGTKEHCFQPMLHLPSYGFKGHRPCKRGVKSRRGVDRPQRRVQLQCLGQRLQVGSVPDELLGAAMHVQSSGTMPWIWGGSFGSASRSSMSASAAHDGSKDRKSTRLNS